MELLLIFIALWVLLLFVAAILGNKVALDLLFCIGPVGVLFWLLAKLVLYLRNKLNV